MDKLGILIVILSVGFLFWKLWLWVIWELEKRIFFRSVRGFLKKSDENKRLKKTVKGKEKPKCG